MFGNISEQSVPYSFLRELLCPELLRYSEKHWANKQWQTYVVSRPLAKRCTSPVFLNAAKEITRNRKCAHISPDFRWLCLTAGYAQMSSCPRPRAARCIGLVLAMTLVTGLGQFQRFRSDEFCTVLETMYPYKS